MKCTYVNRELAGKGVYLKNDVRLLRAVEPLRSGDPERRLPQRLNVDESGFGAPELGDEFVT